MPLKFFIVLALGKTEEQCGGLVLEAPQTLQIPKSCWSSSSITGSSQEMYESSHFPFGSFNHCLKQVTAALNFEIHCDKGDFCYSL